MQHPTIKEGDIVDYQDEKYKVIKIWNHGFAQWWLDLKAVNAILENVNFYREFLSVPSYEINTKP
jgi:hypothetical protein